MLAGNRRPVLQVYIILITALPVLLILLTSLNVRMLADDYCTSVAGRDDGLIGGLTEQYHSWAGQPLNILIKNLVGILGSNAIPVLAVLNIVALGTSIWLMINQIYPTTSFPRGWRAALTLVGLLSLVMIAPSQIQSFYWLAAFVPYTLPLAFAALLVGLVARQMQRGVPSTITVALFGGLAFTAAGFSESYIVIQGGALLAGLLIVAVNRRYRATLLPLLLSALILTVAMGLIILGAPGNTLRRANFPPPPTLSKLIIDGVLSGQALIIVTFVNFSPLAVASAFVLPAYIAFTNNTIPAPNRPWIWLAGVYLLVSLPISLFAAAGIYATGMPPPARTYVISGAVLLFTVGIVGRSAGAWLRHRQRRRPPVLIAAGIITLTAIYGTYQAAQLLPIVREHAIAWDERDRSLRAIAADTEDALIVPPLAFDLAAFTGLETIGADPTTWVNGCAARYYGLDAIMVGSVDEITPAR